MSDEPLPITIVTSEDELEDKPEVGGKIDNEEGKYTEILSSGELKRKSEQNSTKLAAVKRARIPQTGSFNLVSYGSDEEYASDSGSSSTSSDSHGDNSNSGEPSPLQFVISDGGPLTVLSSEHKISDLQAAMEAAQESPAPVATVADDNTQDGHPVGSGAQENISEEKESVEGAESGEKGENGDRNSEVELPPEPEALCSMLMQNTVEITLRRMRHDIDFDPNRRIQDNKEFRNPSIYKKLIAFLKIDEKGTNFSQDIFNPYRWGPESFYDKLGEQQNREVERLEKLRKERRKAEAAGATLVAGANAAAAVPSATGVSSQLIRAASGPNLPTIASLEGTANCKPVEVRKKSKWDTVVPTEPTAEGVATGVASAQPPKVTIPAVGNLFPKK